MKNLAELLVELNKIPNPEKIGVAIMNGDGELELMPKHWDMSQKTNLNALSSEEKEKAVESGFNDIVTF